MAAMSESVSDRPAIHPLIIVPEASRFGRRKPLNSTGMTQHGGTHWASRWPRHTSKPPNEARVLPVSEERPRLR